MLFGLVIAGLLGLAITTMLALNSANATPTQVAATGQALMQSQRLAKAVSQALVGSPQAFPEVKESAEVLARNVRGLKDGDARHAAVPRELQAGVEPLLPLVDRAEKNAEVGAGAAEDADRRSASRCAPSTASRPTCWRSPRPCRR